MTASAEGAGGADAVRPERVKVVYLMGSGHSGSTILGVTLGNCDGYFYAGELDNWLVRKGAPLLGGAERTRFWSEVREDVPGAERAFGNNAHRYLERASAALRLGSGAERRATRERWAPVTEQLYRAIARVSGAGQIVDSSHFPLRARELKRLTGIDVYLIFLVREPQQVVHSFVRTVNRHAVAERRWRTLVTNADMWLTYLLSTAVFLGHRRDRRALLRHEDFLADPHGGAARDLRAHGRDGGAARPRRARHGLPDAGEPADQIGNGRLQARHGEACGPGPLLPHHEPAPATVGGGLLEAHAADAPWQRTVAVGWRKRRPDRLGAAMTLMRRAVAWTSRRLDRPELLAAVDRHAREAMLEDVAIRAVLAASLGEESSYIDIGTNRGQVLAQAALVAPGARLVAFEPVPALAAQLRTSFPGLDCRELALGATEGPAEFTHFRKLDGWSGLRRSPAISDDRGAPEQIEVRVSTLDRELAGGPEPDVVKIDVEGGELDVLCGGRETLTRARPLLLLEHVAEAAALYGASSGALWDELSELGYEIRAMTGGPPLDRAQFCAPRREVNWLARPRSPRSPTA